MIRSTFAVPVLLGLVTIVGLVAALTGDGVRDWISWAALALPLVATGWAMARRT